MPIVRAAAVAALTVSIVPALRAQSSDEILKAGDLATKITVQILTSDFNGRSWSLKTGAGTIIDDSGIVVTCSHVLGKHFEARVRLSDGKQRAARVLGRFPEHDLAVLKFAPPPGLKVVPRLHTGLLPPRTSMICLGFPRGDRKMCPAWLEGYLPNNQTNLISPGTPVIVFKGNIIPGYSGGPLMTMDGGLVGVVFAISPATAQAIAIPIDVLLEDLKRIEGTEDLQPEESPTGSRSS